jgi:hypothetical protein
LYFTYSELKNESIVTYGEALEVPVPEDIDPFFCAQFPHDSPIEQYETRKSEMFNDPRIHAVKPQ